LEVTERMTSKKEIRCGQRDKSTSSVLPGTERKANCRLKKLQGGSRGKPPSRDMGSDLAEKLRTRSTETEKEASQNLSRKRE